VPAVPLLLLLLITSPGWNRGAGVLLTVAGVAVLLPLAMSATGLNFWDVFEAPARPKGNDNLRLRVCGATAGGAAAATTSDSRKDCQQRSPFGI
jgi:hypothetical protein